MKTSITQNENIAAVILAAGVGSRMRSQLPKVMHAVGRAPMFSHVLDTAKKIHAERIISVVADDMDSVRSLALKIGEVAIQKERLGTAHAVKMALPALNGFHGYVAILYGDTPLLRAKTLEQLLETMISRQAAVGVLAFLPENPFGYGRLVCNQDGILERIVEEKDASDSEQKIALCNSGVMIVQAQALAKLLPHVSNHNAKQEYYLTDLIALAYAEGLGTAYIHADALEVLGVNTREELARVEKAFQENARLSAMISGVTLLDPESVYFSYDTKLGTDVIIHPHVVFGPGVEIGDQVEIFSFSHLEGAVLQSFTKVGPFARLRPGAVLENHARVGNFVEIKNTVLAAHAKVNHLSYLGDAEIGRYSNIGAGTITCNYDGFSKHRTIVGEECFIGSDTTLVAPVTLGNGSVIAAGSTITEDVAVNSLAIARSTQTEIAEGGIRYRARRRSTGSQH
jgi:bifunctional UDP-N-acetylglucosamine pyrophosphorylase/glucosamine-1-phosphate N-acetyltransferase